MSIARSVFFAAVLLFGCRVAWASQVSLIVDQFPPYIDKQAKEHGVMTELVEKAFARVGVKTKLEFAGWNDVELAVDDNKQLSFMWLLTKPRYKKWHFSEPVYVQRLKFLVFESFNRDLSHMYNLKGLKLALLRGQEYGKAFDRFRGEISAVEADSDFAAIKMLIAGKVEAVALDPIVAAALLRQYFPSQLVARPMKFVSAPYFIEQPYFLVCGKRYGNCLGHIKKFNRGLKLMELDGSKAQLLNGAQRLKP